MRPQSQKAADFRTLHEGDPFIIPNPWDAGSAKVLAALGFMALATTSSGFAFTLGRTDGGVSLDEVAGHVRLLDEATALPVSVDLENGYGPAPEDAARAIERAAEAGAVGGSIEDYDPDGRIYDRDHGVERVAAAAEAAGRLGFPFTLTARAENHIRGNPDLDDTIGRLHAYARAGADVLYAPGLTGEDDIRRVVEAVAPLPVNVLAFAGAPDVARLAALGVKRISVGGAFAFAAIDAVAEAARELREDGTYGFLERARNGSELARRAFDER